MRMQEPEQWQQPEQQWQTSQEYSEGYSADSVNYSAGIRIRAGAEDLSAKISMVGWHCSSYFRYYLFFDWFLSHRGRHCRVSDRLAVWACAASCPGRRHNRIAKLHWSNAYVCCHLRVCCCHIGTTGKKSPRAGKNWGVKQIVLSFHAEEVKNLACPNLTSYCFACTETIWSL